MCWRWPMSVCSIVTAWHREVRGAEIMHCHAFSLTFLCHRKLFDLFLQIIQISIIECCSIMRSLSQYRIKPYIFFIMNCALEMVKCKYQFSSFKVIHLTALITEYFVYSVLLSVFHITVASFVLARLRQITFTSEEGKCACIL